MSDIICITNRNLCGSDFLHRIEEIAETGPKAVILREKDLTEKEYTALAKQIMEICTKHKVPCVIHSFTETAEALGAEAVHFPLAKLRQMKDREKAGYRKIGTSCHSIEDALEAERLGCTYILAGHIFATDCKKDIPPRGLAFLASVCDAVTIPVYAIGGINAGNFPSVIHAGAKGGCIMSGLMTCPDVQAFMEKFPKET